MTGNAVESQTILVGGLSHGELHVRLSESGVLLNDYANTLLAEALDETNHSIETVSVIERSVKALGFNQGGTLPEIFDRARTDGLRLCPPTTAAFMRLTTPDQASAPDNNLSSGRAPSRSITVAAARLRDDYEFPAGLYLRVIDGQQWLRGFTCDDVHVWSANDVFAFRSGG